MAVDENEGFYLQSHLLTVMYPDAYGAQLRVSNWNKDLLLKRKKEKVIKSKKGNKVLYAIMDFISGVQKLTLQIKQPDKLNKGGKKLTIVSIYAASILDKIQQLFSCPSELKNLKEMRI